MIVIARRRMLQGLGIIAALAFGPARAERRMAQIVEVEGWILRADDLERMQRP
ncbi:MAG: hypothetical protein KDH19_04235 [Geminicoccaceae bacterium]|nr:hypothetical protein [Geminicoccaceae bacterium]